MTVLYLFLNIMKSKNNDYTHYAIRTGSFLKKGAIPYI